MVFWGAVCGYVCLSSCYGGVCDLKNDTCTHGCVAGTFGDICEHNCSLWCVEQACNRHSANCTGGYVPGWFGDQCDSESLCFTKK